MTQANHHTKDVRISVFFGGSTVVEAILVVGQHAVNVGTLGERIVVTGRNDPAGQFVIFSTSCFNTVSSFSIEIGSANEDMVAQGFEIMLSDPKVRGILINIFGGILRCDIVAQGIVNAAKKVNLTLPLVVRMEGTNVEEGRRILASSGLAITKATSMLEAAEKIAELTRRAS